MISTLICIILADIQLDVYFICYLHLVPHIQLVTNIYKREDAFINEDYTW